MTSHKISLLCIAFLLTLLNVFLIIKYTHCKKNNEILLSNAERKIENIMERYDISLYQSYRTNGIILDDIYLTDTNNEKSKLSKLFINRDIILVCRFSEHHCDECTAYSIIKLINHLDMLGLKNVVFLGSYENSKHASVITSNYSCVETYNIQSLNISVEEIHHPYYFTVDRNLRISDVFIPDRSFPHLTNRYLEIVNNKIFNQQNNMKH